MARKRGLATEGTYAPRINSCQKELMIEFIDRHPQLLSGVLSRTFTAGERRKVWEELADILNADGLGATKTAEGWRDSWGEIKSYVKRKTAALRISTEKTGGRHINAKSLTPLEERIAALIDQNNTNGFTKRTSQSESLKETQHAANVDPAASHSELRQESCSSGHEEEGEVQTVQNTFLQQTDRSGKTGRCCNSSSGDDTAIQLPFANGERHSEASEADVMSVDLSCIDYISDDDGCINLPARSKPSAPEDRGPSSKKRRTVQPQREQNTPADFDGVVACQLRAAAAMERLADSINQLVEQQKYELKVKMEMEERKIKVMAERANAEEKKFSIFQQALSSLSAFIFKK